MDNYVGKRLDGRYEIHEIIGVGGMAVLTFVDIPFTVRWYNNKRKIFPMLLQKADG